MKLIESETYKNLAATYAGECQAHIRYKFIEYGARNEGYKAMADIIDKLAYNEFNHARMFYTKLQDSEENPIKNIEICAGYPFKEKWTLLDNLKFASEDEDREASKIYPEFMETAIREGFPEIAELYKQVISVEKQHSKILAELYEELKNKTLYKKPKATIWKCGDCGFEINGNSAPDTCPLCQAKQGAFLLKLPEV